MRVALLSRSAHPLHAPGGLERAVYQLAQHLEARGVETVLLTRPATLHTGRFPGAVVTVPYGGSEDRHGRVLDRTLRYPRFALRLGAVAAELVRSGHVDVVHAQGLTALGYGRLRRQYADLAAPLVMNPQGMEEHQTRGVKRFALARLRTLSREAARLSDRVIATDEATRAEVPRLLGVQPERVVVLPNGIDAAAIAAATPSAPEAVAHAAVPALAGAFPVFLSVGRLESYKGFRDVRAALARIEAQLPERWSWLVVGEGPERAVLAREAGRHVHLVGRVSEDLLHALYARADVFVHATHFEGSSLVTLEAMAHALPVVATRAGGIPDKVVDGVTGRLVEPGDVETLAQSLLELAENAAARGALGRAGRERVLAHFGWSTLVERTLQLYAELLGAHV